MRPAKNSRIYDEDDTLRGYVITLQNFERLIRQGQQDGTVRVTENTIETTQTFDV